MSTQADIDELITLTSELQVKESAPDVSSPIKYLSISILTELLDNYIKYCDSTDKISALLKHKKVRYPPIPGEVTENIVCNYIAKNDPAHGYPIWDKKEKGDIMYLGNIIEVKGYSSRGPTSFGPKCSWQKIYFVDACDFRNKKFKIYEIPLTNTDPRFRAIKFTNELTFGQIAETGKRPRIEATEIYNQLAPQGLFNLVFDGYLADLA